MLKKIVHGTLKIKVSTFSYSLNFGFTTWNPVVLLSTTDLLESGLT